MIFIFCGSTALLGLGLFSPFRFRNRTQTHHTPARRRGYLTHNTYKKQTSMPLAGFEPITPASERPQTQTLDRAAVGAGSCM